jgi:acetyl esterase/lipase
MDGSRTEVYKTVGDTKLNIYVFTPKTHEPNESRPAIVFFFGGGWRSGSPKQFEQHCRYLASRGMIAMTADYRVSSRNQTKANACVMDGKSAIRWIRQNAARLGVDPDRIVAGGGSAGGHVAACTATIDGFDEPGEDTSISSRPNAMALFNPALVLAFVPGNRLLSDEKLASLRDRMGVEPSKLSPFHQLCAGLPPTIIFHGKSDSTVPYRTAEIFTDKAIENGDLVKLEGYAGHSHGFFNFGRDQNKAYLSTVKTLDKFLVDIGCLEGPTPEKVEIK